MESIVILFLLKLHFDTPSFLTQKWAFLQNSTIFLEINPGFS